MYHNRIAIILLGTSVVLGLMFGVISLVVGDGRIAVIGLLALFPSVITGLINYWLGKRKGVA